MSMSHTIFEISPDATMLRVNQANHDNELFVDFSLHTSLITEGFEIHAGKTTGANPYVSIRSGRHRSALFLTKGQAGELVRKLLAELNTITIEPNKVCTY